MFPRFPRGSQTLATIGASLRSRNLSTFSREADGFPRQEVPEFFSLGPLIAFLSGICVLSAGFSVWSFMRDVNVVLLDTEDPRKKEVMFCRR